jgi:hypothetical protein
MLPGLGTYSISFPLEMSQSLEIYFEPQGFFLRANQLIKKYFKIIFCLYTALNRCGSPVEFHTSTAAPFPFLFICIVMFEQA